MGFNPKDGFIYAIESTSGSNKNSLMRINPNTGASTLIGVVTDLPALGSGRLYAAGEIDPDGNFYVMASSGSGADVIYKIDISTQTATPITLSEEVWAIDFAYNVNDGKLYFVNGYDETLSTIDPITGEVESIGSTGITFVDFGAMIGANGIIYGARNGGGFYQFDTTTGVATLIGDSPVTSNNDGAHCVTSPRTFDADVYVTKTDNSATYTPGTAVTYTIVVGNNGPFGATNVTVKDVLPAGIDNSMATVVSATVTGGASSEGTSIESEGSGYVIKDLVNVPKDGTVTYTITLNVPNSYTGNLVNTVTATPDSNTTTDTDPDNNAATDEDTPVEYCYKLPVTNAGTTIPTKHGITALGRAGSDNGNWPMVRQSAWTVLEAKTKGFVVNRVEFDNTSGNPVGIPTNNFVEGMMVYDITNHCLKIYDGSKWGCLTTPACPNN